MISAFKEMEENCLSDYVQVEGDFPVWNFQESGRAWDTHIQQLHAQMLSEMTVHKVAHTDYTLTNYPL